MKRSHTVEKIGGTSMSFFGDVMKNIIIAGRRGDDLYGRIFVVSAYGGVTNLLLEDKKTAKPGVFAKFARNDRGWEESLDVVRKAMLKINRGFAGIGLDVKAADAFVNERIDGLSTCLSDIIRLRSFGHFKPDDYLPATREFLSAAGEAHSAYNSVLILQANGVNAIFVDLTGWMESESKPFDKVVKQAFKGIDLHTQLPIVTGYVKCDEGIMSSFDRGYSEITFSKVAVLTGASEGVIHKEFHLSTGDPKLIGVDNVKTIGFTNFDIADQLADMGMEAIHSKASKKMELKGIPIRVKNTFEPDDPGTLISKNYVSDKPKIDMICGREDIVAIEVFDSDMVGQHGYDLDLLQCLARHKISYIAKNTNANTITHYVSEKSKGVNNCIKEIRRVFPGAQVRIEKVAIVSAIGNNMKIPGFLYKAAKALSDEGINILALDQCMRQVNMQFVISRENFKKAQIAMHHELVEKTE
ncbi:MAG: aspartate kinase [Victivallales bacterium]|nr:aspartate kinase [Victivallales bacterium]